MFKKKSGVTSDLHTHSYFFDLLDLNLDGQSSVGYLRPADTRLKLSKDSEHSQRATRLNGF